PTNHCGPRVEAARRNRVGYHDPLHLPRLGRGAPGAAIDALRRRLLRRTLRRLGFERPILWLVRPECWDVPGTLGERLVLYHVVDDYSTYGGMTEGARARVDREERLLAAKADLIVVTSEHLLEAKRHLGERLVLVRNAVDRETLEEGRRAEGPVPPELAAAPRPILGYIGGVTEKLDLDLLEMLALRWAEPPRRGTLALVGATKVFGREAVEKVARLRSLPNVVFTGRKDAHLVPSCIRAFDVCLVPYRLEGQSRGIDPLKLYEYLAFGKPIVAADIPSVQRFAGVLRIARDREEFVAGVDEALRERDPEIAERRRRIASENTWERRAEEISRAVEEAIRRRDGSPAPRG
ncbi:MAG: glycosyltransferase, partial [Planctomycetota bacterium]